MTVSNEWPDFVPDEVQGALNSVCEAHPGVDRAAEMTVRHFFARLDVNRAIGLADMLDSRFAARDRRAKRDWEDVGVNAHHWRVSYKSANILGQCAQIVRKRKIDKIVAQKEAQRKIDDFGAALRLSGVPRQEARRAFRKMARKTRRLAA